MSKKFAGRYSCLRVEVWLLLLLLVGTVSAAYPEPKESDVNIQGYVWHWVPVPNKKVQADDGWYPRYEVNKDKDGEFLTMDTSFGTEAYIERYFDVPSDLSNLYLEVWGASNIRGWCGSPVNVEISVIDSSNTKYPLANFVPVQRYYNIGPGEEKVYSTSFRGQRVKIRITQTSDSPQCAIGNYKNIRLHTEKPIAYFKMNQTGWMVPLTIKFIDLSIGATSWEWDFNNDGVTDSNLNNPSYTYNNPGTYTVSLKVHGPIGPVSEMKQFIVVDENIQNVEVDLDVKQVAKVDEEVKITLLVTNLKPNPPIDVQLYLRVPPEMGDCFSTTVSKASVGCNYYFPEENVTPMNSRSLEGEVKLQQVGTFNIIGKIVITFGNKNYIKMLTRTIKTESEQSIIDQEQLPVPTVVPIVSTPKAPDFDVALAIVIQSTVYLIRKRYN